jgi:hypothetical protein
MGVARASHRNVVRRFRQPDHFIVLEKTTRSPNGWRAACSLSCSRDPTASRDTSRD